MADTGTFPSPNAETFLRCQKCHRPLSKEPGRHDTAVRLGFSWANHGGHLGSSTLLACAACATGVVSHIRQLLEPNRPPR